MGDNRLIKKLNLAGISGRGTGGGDPKGGEGKNISDMMLDHRYLRQSSALINESLQKGFDVLQLSDGSIVTTGTKTVVHHYKWDEEKGKLVKTKSETSGVVPAKKARQTRQEQEEEDEAQEEEA